MCYVLLYKFGTAQCSIYLYIHHHFHHFETNYDSLHNFEFKINVFSYDCNDVYVMNP